MDVLLILRKALARHDGMTEIVKMALILFRKGAGR